jgi:hypothetical protein
MGIVALYTHLRVFLKDQPILSVIVLIFSILLPTATLYLTFFRHPESLNVYFRFNDPAQVGTATLDLGYFFSNGGSKSYMIENISIHEVWQKTSEPVSIRNVPINPTVSDLSICENKASFEK